MSSKAEKDKTKQLQDKCQSVLNALLRDEDNKYCVDCDSKGPRWASWNLGVFLCIRCAGIHRNLGVHISKVKSVNLDSWTPEQVVSLQQMGNSRARAVYEANLPDNFRRPQNDSSLETFIRGKYEHKKYIAREWVPPSLPEVNWEKEIDEEIERQKRKKKTIVERKSLGAVEVPQLPKPKNASPKPGRAQAQPTPLPVTTENKLNADLLGLQNGDDSFSNFLSAPVSTPAPNHTKIEKKDEKIDPAKSEEESFFNQTAPTEKEKVKLTKDSILALYGSAPPVNNFNPNYPTQQQQQQQPQQFNTNFSQQQQNFPANFGAFPPQQQQQQQNFQMQNQFPSNAQFQNQFPNQFALNNQFSLQQQQQQPNYQFQQQNQFANPPMMQQGNAAPQFAMNQFPQQQQQNNFPNMQQPPNPFFNQSSLPQQFGNMSLAGQNGTSNPATVAGNIWQ